MFRAYDKNVDISYSLGAFPTVELIKKCPQDIIKIALHSKLKVSSELESILSKVADKVVVDDKSVERIAKKGNIYVVGAFHKRLNNFGQQKHICLVKPSDAGNLGTIMRTMLGFGVKNLAIVGDAVDCFDPKVIRASMGSIFSINIERYADWQDYEQKHSEQKYLFMLGSNVTLTDIELDNKPFAMVFGNEATGLDHALASKGQAVVIKHSSDIDSLNLPQAVGIALYELTKNEFNN